MNSVCLYRRPLTRALRAIVPLLLIAAALLLTGQRLTERAQPGQPPTAAPLPVEVVTLRASTFEVARSYSGTVEARRRATLSASLSAQVTEVKAREGQRVKAGDLLVSLDNRELRDSVRQLQATRARTRADYDYWLAQQRRYQRLFKQGSISQQSLDEATSNVARFSAALEETEAGIRLARTRLSYSRITAPFDAEVQSVFTEEGQMAVPGAPLMELVSAGDVKILLGVPQSDLADIDTTTKARIAAPGSGEHPYLAQVHRIYPALDGSTHTATMELYLDNPTATLRPGMVADVSVVLHREEAAIALPREAVQGSQVYVVEGTRAVRRRVRLGSASEGLVQVLEGLSPGETVVVTSEPRLATGVELWPLEREAAL